MGKNFEGIQGFDSGWVKIYKELLEDAQPEDLLSPTGHVKRIMQHETGLMFIHAAKKAIRKKQFSSSLFAIQSVDALIETFSDKIAAAADAMETTLRARFYRSSQDDMQTLAHFGLFKVHNKGLYSLTEKGRRYYDFLENDNEENDNEPSSKAYPMASYPGWGYSQVTVHYVPWK